MNISLFVATENLDVYRRCTIYVAKKDGTVDRRYRLIRNLKGVFTKHQQIKLSKRFRGKTLGISFGDFKSRNAFFGDSTYKPSDTFQIPNNDGEFLWIVRPKYVC